MEENYIISLLKVVEEKYTLIGSNGNMTSTIWIVWLMKKRMHVFNNLPSGLFCMCFFPSAVKSVCKYYPPDTHICIATLRAYPVPHPGEYTHLNAISTTTPRYLPLSPVSPPLRHLYFKLIKQWWYIIKCHYLQLLLLRLNFLSF